MYGITTSGWIFDFHVSPEIMPGTSKLWRYGHHSIAFYGTAMGIESGQKKNKAGKLFHPDLGQNKNAQLRQGPDRQ